MNATDYDSKILSHLNDTITYKTITHDRTDQFADNIINELKQLNQNGKITPKLYNKFFPVVVSVLSSTVYQKYINRVFP